MCYTSNIKEGSVMNIMGNVRLERLRVKNIKSVGDGEIYFSEQKKLSRGELDEDDFSSVIGLYGQNGSGKTSIIRALRMLQTILSSRPVSAITLNNLLTKGKKDLSIEADFLVKKGDVDSFYVQYSICIAKGLNDTYKVTDEKFSYTKFDNDDKKNNVFSFSLDGINKTFLSKLSDTNAGIYSYLSRIETNSEGPNNPFSLFSSVFDRKLVDLVRKGSKGLEDYLGLVISISFFASTRMSIYEISYFNEIESNLGIRFRSKEEHLDENKVELGDIFVPFQGFAMDISGFNKFKKLMDRINVVMGTIIPNYKIDIEEKSTSKMGDKIVRVEFALYSNRNGVKIPLSWESNGIKKIISILSGFMEAFNNEGHLMIIDEFDSGVFEYLLGEFLYTFQNFGKGQFIFTSHNLRPLEKLDYSSIFFTTTDRNMRFARITNIHNTNNLRDVYYKRIALQDSKPKFYDFVRTEDIISSLFEEDFCQHEKDIGTSGRA